MPYTLTINITTKCLILTLSLTQTLTKIYLQPSNSPFEVLLTCQNVLTLKNVLTYLVKVLFCPNNVARTNTRTHIQRHRNVGLHCIRRLQSADFELKAEGHQSKISVPHLSMSSIMCSLYSATHSCIEHFCRHLVYPTLMLKRMHGIIERIVFI